MPREIERKYLVMGDGWRAGAEGVLCRQGYLCVGPPVAVRVRIMGEESTINVKAAVVDITRDEYEYPIPMGDAEELLEHHCMGHPIEKTRHVVRFAGKKWEIDEFHGVNGGLIVAEIELDNAEEEFEKPPWLAEEVSGDPRYLNSHLTMHPFSKW